MTKRAIITLPDPLLRQQSAPVERVDDELRALVGDMFDTMYDAPGIGLAGVQIAVPRRVIVMGRQLSQCRRGGGRGAERADRDDQPADRRAWRRVARP